jgi:hypothetical protein
MQVLLEIAIRIQASSQKEVYRIHRAVLFRQHKNLTHKVDSSRPVGLIVYEQKVS